MYDKVLPPGNCIVKRTAIIVEIVESAEVTDERA